VCEELMQDIFMAIYKKNIGLRANDLQSQKYLFVMARSFALDYIRRETRRNKKLYESILPEINKDDILNSSLEDYYIEGEVISSLHDVINSFPENERDIFLETHLTNEGKNKVREKYKISLYKINKIDEKISTRIKRKLKNYYNNDS
jgi:DNA-directed RNA polymerase specialized sigma24 family protein